MVPYPVLTVETITDSYYKCLLHAVRYSLVQ